MAKRILVVVFMLGVLLVFAFGCGPQPIDGLWNVPIQTAAPPLSTPTLQPTPIPKTEPPIIISPETVDAKPSDDALFILNVIVEDHYGFLQEALLTIIWEDDVKQFVVGPTADVKIPIQASSPLFLLKVEKEGYSTVYQPFDVTLSEDMEYEFTVTLIPSGDPA